MRMNNQKGRLIEFIVIVASYQTCLLSCHSMLIDVNWLD